MPTLRETFAATGSVRIDAELKTLPDRPDATVSPSEMAGLVLAVAAACGALGRLDVRSFDWRGLWHVRARSPAVPLTFLTVAETVAQAALWWDGPTPGRAWRLGAAGGGRGRGGRGWAPDHRDLTRAQVQEAHVAGVARACPGR